VLLNCRYRLPPRYHGAYFFADFAAKEMRCIFFSPDGRTVIGEETFDTEAGQVVSITQGPDVSWMRMLCHADRRYQNLPFSEGTD